MDSESILSHEDCEKPRTQEELIAWVQQVHAQFGADEGTKNYARLGKGLSKQFYEEIMPLSHLACHKYAGKRGIYLQPKLGNQSYDAEIFDRSLTPVRSLRLELVNAAEGYEEALRMEHLVEHGDVYMTGPVWREGTKAAGGRVQTQSEAVKHGDYVKKQLASIEQKANKKLQKDYGPDTLLGIVFNDYLPFDPRKDTDQLKAFLESKVVEPVLRKFRGFFVIGSTGQIVLEFGDTGI